MSVLLIYIPKKYRNWDMISENLRSTTIKRAKYDIKSDEAGYIYDEREIPVASKHLRDAWKKLMNEGILTESEFGYYDEDECFMVCHIFSNITNLIGRLDINIDGFSLGDDFCSCIVNLSSKHFLQHLKRVMIEEIFK